MTQNNYHPISRALHWLMFILFAIGLTAVELHDQFPKGDPWRSGVVTIHMLVGQLILLFAIFRVIARYRFGVPAATPGPRWQTGSAHLVHALLYLLMFALPISGILFVQAGGKDVLFFGLALPHLIAPNPDLRHTIKDLHEWMGNAVYFVAGLHIIAALWHQFIVKDNVFGRMLGR